ncbi:MAG: lipocalin family protein [Gammaproteobacteria bacterium]
MGIIAATRRALLVPATLALAACATGLPEFGEEQEPLRSVGYVDLDRYMGRWYLIANIPNFAEQGNIAPYVEYTRRSDGLIDDKYTALDEFGGKPFTKDGYIEITNPMTGAEGRITFLPPLWRDYAVIFLDPEYRYTVVGLQDRDYIWFFAREPKLSDEVYQAMLGVARANGFDVTQVLRFPHRPEERGLPGYQ